MNCSLHNIYFVTEPFLKTFAIYCSIVLAPLVVEINNHKGQEKENSYGCPEIFFTDHIRQS